MQIRLRTSLNDQEYVVTQAWRRVQLKACPQHPKGGCSFARRGSYARKTPYGEARIVRWYCAASHATFSRLPDCLAARLPGTLTELERPVLIGEREADPARQAHANPRVTPKAARRWLRRRQEMVSKFLRTIVGLLPDLFAGCPPTVGELRAPLGFFWHEFGVSSRKPTLQHKLGRDAPRLWR